MTLETLSSSISNLPFFEESDCDYTFQEKESGELSLRKDSEHTAITVCSDEEEDEDDDLLDYNYDYCTPNDRFCIGFEPTDQVLFIDSHLTYSEEERQNCWYTEIEKEQMMNDVYKVVARMEAEKPQKRNSPYRGLDAWTTNGSTALLDQVRRVIDAVVDELEAQWSEGIEDDEAMAEISRSLTAGHVEKALHIASVDEQEAIAIRGKEST